MGWVGYGWKEYDYLSYYRLDCLWCSPGQSSKWEVFAFVSGLSGDMDTLEMLHPWKSICRHCSAKSCSEVSSWIKMSEELGFNIGMMSTDLQQIVHVLSNATIIWRVTGCFCCFPCYPFAIPIEGSVNHPPLVHALLIISLDLAVSSSWQLITVRLLITVKPLTVPKLLK